MNECKRCCKLEKVLRDSLHFFNHGAEHPSFYAEDVFKRIISLLKNKKKLEFEAD